MKTLFTSFNQDASCFVVCGIVIISLRNISPRHTVYFSLLPFNQLIEQLIVLRTDNHVLDLAYIHCALLFFNFHPSCLVIPSPSPLVRLF